MAGPLFMRAAREARRAAPADRQRAQRRLPVPVRQAGKRGAAHRAHGFGRPVPRHAGRALDAVTPDAGLRASELGDGPQDLGRFGHHDEQGPRGDRGALPLRRAAGVDRGGDPSAEHRALAGRVRRRLGARAAVAIPTCACRSRTRWRIPSASLQGATPLDLAAMKSLVVRAARPATASPACGSPTPRSRAGGTAPAVLNAANEVAVAAFLDAAAAASPASRADR